MSAGNPAFLRAFPPLSNPIGRLGACLGPLEPKDHGRAKRRQSGCPYSPSRATESTGAKTTPACLHVFHHTVVLGHQVLEPLARQSNEKSPSCSLPRPTP